jgi:CubicO group peptidase (beta-lactamase class C family)
VGGLRDLALRGAPVVLPHVPWPVRRSPVPDDLGAVTRVRQDVEVAPGRVGMPPDAAEQVWAAVQRVYRTGVHPAIALCLRRDGEVVLDRTIGHAVGNGPDDPPGTPAVTCTPDHPFVLASASKAITAMVVHLLDDRGLLHVDDRVCEYIPEFAAHGKHAITIGHVLSHRAGVPNLPHEALDLDLLGDRAHLLDQLSRARPILPPGRWAAYHAVSGGFILGEVVRRVTGQGIEQVLREEVLDPLGFTGLGYGVPGDRLDDVVRSHRTGLPVLPPLSTLLERALGLPFERAVEVLDDPRFLSGVVPAANVVGTAHELSRFYELLRRRGELDGVRVFEPRTIHRAVTEQSWMEVDLTLGFPVRYGMGFMLGARVLSLFGPHTGHAFGHLGFTNVVGWADPERRLAGALLTSGKPVLGPHLLAIYDVMRTIASVTPRDGLVDGGVDWA